MVTYVLYNKGTPAERTAAELVGRLEKEQVAAELLDADSARGIALAESYDILGRPAVVLVKDDGAPVKVWQGPEEVPVVSEIVYWAHQ